MGKKQKTLQFKCLENQRVVEIFSHHDHLYAPNPNFPAKRTDRRLWGQEAPLERTGIQAGVLEASLATQGLKQGLRPFLPAGDGAALLSSAASGPPPRQQLSLEGSPSPGKLGGSSPMPPLSSADLTWLLITHGLYYFSFVL